MATMTVTETSKEAKNNNEKESSAKKKSKAAATPNDLDSVLGNIKDLDNTCKFQKCKNRTTNFAIQCKYCNGRFCTTHGLPEVHGCGEAVRRDEKRTFLHPHAKLSEEKHSQAATKLSMKLKQMQLERKPKLGSSSKGKKK